jgi:hypothetical protein
MPHPELFRILLFRAAYSRNSFLLDGSNLYTEKGLERGNTALDIHGLDSTAGPLRLPHRTNTRGVPSGATPASKLVWNPRRISLPSPPAQCSPSFFGHCATTGNLVRAISAQSPFGQASNRPDRFRIH